MKFLKPLFVLALSTLTLAKNNPNENWPFQPNSNFNDNPFLQTVKSSMERPSQTHPFSFQTTLPFPFTNNQGPNKPTNPNQGHFNPEHPNFPYFFPNNNTFPVTKFPNNKPVTKTTTVPVATGTAAASGTPLPPIAPIDTGATNTTVGTEGQVDEEEIIEFDSGVSTLKATSAVLASVGLFLYTLF